ncbi:MAG: tRNA (adenosine(37)-N6)-threonylcarbamoyltransferase complex ATPase subunit type 1 TsaE [Candidatus Omnitrophica bacterium]|nr:tRNA (adenosine(37)-N6)-threonylcarbamoyltransferase complex ATPase subunit type 1 TsaE [Candidatus Omnitrophota bacterium]
MKVTSHSRQDTIKLGRIIARYLKPEDILCLFGELGAGKTVLVKGIAEGLGIDKKKVVSPSFILLRIHEKARLPLYHFDLYRMGSPEAIACAGFEEYLCAEGVCVIEWADRMKYLLPQEFLKIELLIKGKNSRLLNLSAFGERYKKLLRQIYEPRTF